VPDEEEMVARAGDGDVEAVWWLVDWLVN
jgi:hypothetical protein